MLIKTILAAAVLLTFAPAFGTEYVGKRNVGSTSISYDITTDGTIGSLSSSNLSSFRFSITDGTLSDTFSKATGGYFETIGQGLIASTSGLAFDFDTNSSSVFGSDSSQRSAYSDMNGIEVVRLLGSNTVEGQSGPLQLAVAGNVLKPITYYGNRTVGLVKVSFNITTDGTTGTLKAPNFASYDIALSNGQVSDSFSSSENAYYETAGQGIIATYDGLFYDFNDEQSTAVFGSNSEQVSAYSLQPNLEIARLLQQNTVIGAAGNVQIATVASVPEPSNWAMIITGFGLIGALNRRHKRDSLA
ncbi:MAG: PEPxxWA-CTERM sorting domain-containing protein [Janthinobacterium lividum]